MYEKNNFYVTFEKNSVFKGTSASRIIVKNKYTFSGKYGNSMRHYIFMYGRRENAIYYIKLTRTVWVSNICERIIISGNINLK